MARHLERQIEQLKQRILFVGSVVERAIANAITALVNRDDVLAKRVIAEDDEVDRLEVDVEEECLKILALYQPVAVDLRFVVAALKINNDLERMGDLAKNIAKRVLYLSRAEPLDLKIDFRPIAEKAQEMVKNALDAMVKGDVALAQKVRHDDSELDAMRRNIHERIIAAIQEQPDRAEALFRLDSVSRHLERLGDMSTNIAEDVIYMVQGDIVRHRDED